MTTRPNWAPNESGLTYYEEYVLKRPCPAYRRALAEFVALLLCPETPRPNTTRSARCASKRRKSKKPS
jgi:hypothetical protein